MSAKQVIDDPIIDADLPIIDAHHHLWYRPEKLYGESVDLGGLIPGLIGPVIMGYPRYLLEEFLADTNSGHNFIASIFVETGAMYRASGATEMRCVGEIEFANGIAAMAASGLYGPTKVCAAIVGNADLARGAAIAPVLEAQIAAGGSRFRGVRYNSVFDVELWPSNIPEILLDRRFREGFALVEKLGLIYEAAVVEPQLPDLIDLARSFPGTSIVLNHIGMPFSVGRMAGRSEERFPIWRDNMRKLAASSNVSVKISGLGSPVNGFKSFRSVPPASSAQLAAEWGPYVDTCIELFGTDRCMFASNYPVDAGSCTYRTLWNTFKRLSIGASKEEKSALFSDTAKRIYRISL